MHDKVNVQLAKVQAKLQNDADDRRRRGVCAIRALVTNIYCMLNFDL